MTRFSLALAALLPALAAATLGVDVSQPVSESAARCMVSSGFNFGIVRGYCSFGGVDTNA
jgi:hypothetical protein